MNEDAVLYYRKKIVIVNHSQGGPLQIQSFISRFWKNECSCQRKKCVYVVCVFIGSTEQGGKNIGQNKIISK